MAESTWLDQSMARCRCRSTFKKFIRSPMLLPIKDLCRKYRNQLALIQGQKGYHDERMRTAQAPVTESYSAGLAGTGGANHAGDAAILAAAARVRARQQEAAASAEPGPDARG